MESAQTIKKYPTQTSLQGNRELAHQEPRVRRFKKESNQVLNQIQSCKDFLGKRKDILDRVMELQRLQLLQPRPVVLQSQKLSHGRGYIMNDYHERQTNPGYSRNKTGGFYTS